MELELALICCSGADSEAAVAATEHCYPKASLVYVSPEAGSRELAARMYPRVPAILCNQLRPFDYGALAGKDLDQQKREKALQGWATNPITQPCPEGESPYQLGVRCAHMFRKIVEEMCAKGIGEAAILADNAVVSSMMRRYCIPRSLYRNWCTSFGSGYLIRYDTALFTGKILRAI